MLIMSRGSQERSSGPRQATKPKHVSSIEQSISSRRYNPEQRRSLRDKLRANFTQLRLTILVILAIALALLGLAFFSGNWLESEGRYYGSKFKKLGLWRACFNSYSAPDDSQFRKFYVGCRWLYSEEYKPIRKFLLPGFFMITQVLFTAGFLLLILVCAGILAVQQCFVIEREDYALRALSVASAISATSCTSAVVIFALNGDRKDWMPDPEHNFLSWSFAAAAVGSTLLWVVSLLFYIDMRLMIKRELSRGMHSQG